MLCLDNEIMIIIIVSKGVRSSGVAGGHAEGRRSQISPNKSQKSHCHLQYDTTKS